MSLISNIFKASSAVSVLCGAVYYYFKKSNSYQPSTLCIDRNNTFDSDKASNIMDILFNIDKVSKNICSEIDLNVPTEGLKKSISMSILRQLDNNDNNSTLNILKAIEDTLTNVSIRTKNESFLDKFISQNGLSMLQDLFLYFGISNFCDNKSQIILSEIFSNISQKIESLELFEYADMQNLLNSWVTDKNIMLNLNAVKIYSNISQLKSTFQSDKVFYTPDIFLLDDQEFIINAKDFDIVFINGMLGSVYFTWRQHDDEIELESEEKTKCWPRDWLSPEFPNARIIGINALLRPFVWNPMSDIDKKNRSMDDRAIELVSKLDLAGIGKRPVLWICHSAGGILLKKMMKLSENKPLTLSTRGIMFMSTPHCGAQSLLGLYYFPFKFLLTPEARHLETNSEQLLKLNDEFKKIVQEKNIKIVTLTETEPTQINKFYSTIIVPKCDGDFQEHEQHEVQSNHLYISKPKNQKDKIFLAVLDFVNQTTKDL